MLSASFNSSSFVSSRPKFVVDVRLHAVEPCEQRRIQASAAQTAGRSLGNAAARQIATPVVAAYSASGACNGVCGQLNDEVDEKRLVLAIAR